MLRMVGLSIALIALVSLAGCEVATNSMEVFLTNSTEPAGANAVKIAISDVSFNKSADPAVTEGWISLPLQTSYDVLTLQDDARQLLGTVGLDPATYRQVRVTIASATVKVGNRDIKVTIPTRVRFLPLSLVIAEEKHYGILLNFNAQANLTQNLNVWTLTDPPTITLQEVYRINDEGVNVLIPQD